MKRRGSCSVTEPVNEAAQQDHNTIITMEERIDQEDVHTDECDAVHTNDTKRVEDDDDPVVHTNTSTGSDDPTTGTPRTSVHNSTLRMATFVRFIILLRLSTSSSSSYSSITQTNNNNNNNKNGDLPFWVSHSSNLHSILINPLFTLHTIHEARAIRLLSSSPSAHDTYHQPLPPPHHHQKSRSRRAKFAHAYYQRDSDQQHSPSQHPTGRVHLPPLLLLAFEIIMVQLLHSNVFLIRLFTLLIDVIIAMQLYQLVSNLWTIMTEHPKSRTELQIMTHDMNPKLYPSIRMLQLIPISSSSSSSSHWPTTGRNNTETGPTVTNQNGTSSATETTKATTMDTKMRPASLLQWNDLPTVISLLYFINPITILATSVSFQNIHKNDASFQNLVTLLVVHTIHLSTKKRSEISIVYISFLLSILSYIDCHYTLLLIPIILLVVEGQEQQLAVDGDREQHAVKSTSTTAVIMLMVVLYIFWTLLLHTLSVLLVGLDHYYAIVVTTHLHTFRITNLQPNLSLVWYFGMEVFVPFHRYFTFLIGGLPYFTVVPMTIRLYRYPCVLVRLCLEQCTRRINSSN